MYYNPKHLTEAPWYMFVAARVFGRKIAKNVYKWRGQIWICGPIEEQKWK